MDEYEKVLAGICLLIGFHLCLLILLLARWLG